MPLEEKIYDLSVQIEALAKTVSVELTSLQISPSTTVTTVAVAATTKPVASSASPGSTVASPEAAGAALLKDANILHTKLSLGVSGSYESVQSFIGGLTRLQRFISIDQVGLTASDTGAFTAQITAQAYSYRYVQPKP